MTALVGSGLADPLGLAVDGAGNVYFADSGNNAIKKWMAASNTVTTLVSNGLSQPWSVAVDGAGNVYIADSGNNAIKEWMAANSNVTILVSSGLNHPRGVALDNANNVYIADTANSAIREWSAASHNLTTLVSNGLANPSGVAVDAAGNVYIADADNNAIKEWILAHNTVTTLVSNLNAPQNVAVDSAGNVYTADTENSAVKKWTAASNTVTTLVPPGLSLPYGVAVDNGGNVYVADTGNNAIEELPYAFVDPATRTESDAAGNDALPVVVPATENLLAPFAPSSDTNWLNINFPVTKGVVNYSFTPNPGAGRVANITLLGQTIAITQGGATFSLGTSNLLEGPAGGADSVVLVASANFGTWTAAVNDAPWLHLGPASQSGTGSMNVVFTYDANTNGTRTNTLTIAGQTLTVTQAGSSYVSAQMTTLVSSDLSNPYGVAVDGTGNVYIADSGNSAIKEWTPGSNTATTLVSSGLSNPRGVAVDGAGNTYISDYANNAIYEWSAANKTNTTLVSSGLFAPLGVAVDGAGNVYIADFGDGAVKEWRMANSNVITLASSVLFKPSGTAVDAAGNVYFADSSNNAIKKWTVAHSNLTTLVTGLAGPSGVAVDGSGNVYVADTGNNAIRKWTAANSNVITLVSSGLNGPRGVAVDGAGNIYIADTGNNAIEELPHAFVDTTPRFETNAAGNDALPVVLPSMENLLAPFTPTVDQPWLTITGTANGVVSFSFVTNTGPSRTAHIALFGQSIAVTQAGLAAAFPILSSVQMLGQGVLRIEFNGAPNASFTVLSTTNVSALLNDWQVAGIATNIGSGIFQFTSQPTTNDPERFYLIRSP